MPSRDRPATSAGTDYVAESAMAAQVLRSGHGGARVLLAEDQPLNRELFSELLKAAGLEVEAVSSGADAMLLARDRRYDLVLTDLQLPGLSGLQLARGIRALDGAAGRVPIIAITAAEVGSVWPQCQRAGIQDVMHKPMTPVVLYAAAANALDGAAAVRRPQRAETRPLPLGVSVEQLDARLIDTAQGLAFFAGRSEAYLRALRQFASEQQQGLTVSLSLGPDDEAPADDPQWRRQAQREVHGIGGVAAAIGAAPVLAHARRIERELLAGLAGPQLRQSLMQMNNDLIALAQHLAAQFKE